MQRVGCLTQPPPVCDAAARRGRRCALHRAAPPPQPLLQLRAAAAHARRSGRVHCSAGDAAAKPDSLRSLEAALAAAIAREDYPAAAALRDKLRFARADATQGIEAASALFYSAFERMNLRDMTRAWGVGDHVSCIHPGAACITGREQVLASWDLVFRAGGKLKISVQDVQIHATETLGYITCTEVVDSGTQTGRLACTNIFELQSDGAWRMVHHHACPAPRV